MHTDLKVGTYWGEKGVDNWDANMWNVELEKHEVGFLFLYFFMIPIKTWRFLTYEFLNVLFFSVYGSKIL